MTFVCGGCNRTLPNWMETPQGTCTQCSEEGDTREALNNAQSNNRPEAGTASRKEFGHTQTRNNATDSSGSDGVEVSTNRSSEKTELTSSKSESESGSSSTANAKNRVPISDDSHAQLYLQPSIPEEYQNLSKAHVFALGRYNSQNYKADEYSYKLVKFAKESDSSHLAVFAEQLSGFFECRVEELVPDVVTTYPGHAGGHHQELVSLVAETTVDRSFQYESLLARRENRPSQREQSGLKRWENQLGSISITGDVAERTVILLDDVCTTGASLTVGTNKLLNAGAERVVCVCLGLSTKQWGEYIKQLRDERHTIMSTINDDD